MSTRILRSHAQDKSAVTTALELCAIENPTIIIPKTTTNGGSYTSRTWPQVDIGHVSDLEDLTYENIISAFEPLLTQPFNYDPRDIQGWKDRALTKSEAEEEKTFVLYCEHWLIPMLELIFKGIGHTYKIDLAIVDDGDQAGKLPKFKTWPGRIHPSLKSPDFGSVYTTPRIWISVADAKLAKTWDWEDRHRRRLDNGLVKFISPCRQLAAYGCLSKTQYVIPVTPKEVCFCRLVDHGLVADEDKDDDDPLSWKQIGIQGTTVKWTTSGRGTVTVLLGMVAWILAAMNEDHRPIVPLGSQVCLNEWVMIQDGDTTRYRNKISQRTLDKLPHGAIITS